MIQRTLLFVLVSLLSAACTAGVTDKESLAPNDPTTSPLTQSAPTESPLPTPTSAPQPTLAPTAAPVAPPHSIEQLNLVAGRYDTVFVRGNQVFVSDGTALAMLDISDPAQPSQLGSTALPGVNDIHVADNYAYVTALSACDGFGGGCQVNFIILDVSNPDEMAQIGIYQWPQRAQMPWSARIAVAGNTVYVADASTGLLTLDISNPAAPVQISLQDGHAWDVEVNLPYAYVLFSAEWGLWNLQVWNVSTPSAPFQLGLSRAYEWAAAQDLALAGDHVYVSDISGLHVMDASDRAAPVEVGGALAPAAGWDVVAASGSYAYAAGPGGLWALDVSDPAAPDPVAHYDLQGPTWDVAVLGDYIYAAVPGAGLYVLRHVHP